jgi:tetratricopeptide (TPR) repeat protein
VGSGCLDEEVVVAFLAGGLGSQERTVVQRHLGACDACAEVVTWAAADHGNGSRSAASGGRPFVGALAPGSRVDRYQILGAVGRGGMGEVYAAYHPDLDRRIALKVVSELGADAPERRARLLREARAIARFSHPNVVAVYDAGTVGDRVYIVMEFVEGETVDRWLRSRPRSWREILEVFISASRGLAAAHAAGIVHRDFKPQNVMIGRDGSVRVMDFGLARLTGELIEPGTAEAAYDSRFQISPTVTKTGALVGTLAYMAPEQFRGEKVDARADQFSFGVALYEALYGSRPAVAHTTGTSGEKSPGLARGANGPGWVRAVVSRCFAENRDERFASMNDLIAALARGQARPRRRVVGASVVIASLLVGLGGWRVARGARVNCAVPFERLATAWSGHDDARRQSIHHAFSASGRASAETSWQRASKLLDDYIGQWSAMYVDTCEATHVRGEQSPEVLDLRMTCLNDGVDQVRALTNVFASADSSAVAHAVAATQDLTHIQRCADVTSLRSAVPLPRDQRTLDAVRELRGSLREAEALRDVGNFQAARSQALALRSRVAATGYRPLEAQLLELVGCASGFDDPNAEGVLHQALFAAEAGHDDATAARAAADLIILAGAQHRRFPDAEMWLRFTESILDRLGPGFERTRAWAWHDFAEVLIHRGDLQRAENFAWQAVALKEQVLGKEHPDVAISLGLLSDVFDEEGKAAEGLDVANRSLDILAKHGDSDSDIFAANEHAKASSLLALGRGVDAQAAFEDVLRITRRDFGPDSRKAAFALQGIGAARLLQGDPRGAISLLEDAMRIREAREPFSVLVAETRFTLARALWEGHGDRKRAVRLAQAAKDALSSFAFPRREHAVIQWLAEHHLKGT